MKKFISFIMVSICCVLSAPAQSAQPVVLKNSVVDTLPLDSAKLDTVVYRYKKTVTLEFIDRFSSLVITRDSRDSIDTLSFEPLIPVTCGDARIYVTDLAPGNAITITIRKYRGAKTILHITKKGCPRTSIIPSPPIWIPQRIKTSANSDTAVGSRTP